MLVVIAEIVDRIEISVLPFLDTFLQFCGGNTICYQVLYNRCLQLRCSFIFVLSALLLQALWVGDCDSSHEIACSICSIFIIEKMQFCFQDLLHLGLQGLPCVCST